MYKAKEDEMVNEKSIQTDEKAEFEESNYVNSEIIMIDNLRINEKEELIKKAKHVKQMKLDASKIIKNRVAENTLK